MGDYSKVMMSRVPKKAYDKMVPIQIGNPIPKCNVDEFNSQLQKFLSNLSNDQLEQLKKDLYINS